MTYAALTNKRVVIVSRDRPYVAMTMGCFRDLLAPVIKQVQVDEVWYCSANPGIVSAIQSGEIESPRDHYVRFGYFEHRMPYEITVQQEWYLGEYPDVKEAVELGHFASAQDHFSEVGYSEGRIPFPGFQLRRHEVASPR